MANVSDLILLMNPSPSVFGYRPLQILKNYSTLCILPLRCDKAYIKHVIIHFSVSMQCFLSLRNFGVTIKRNKEMKITPSLPKWMYSSNNSQQTNCQTVSTLTVQYRENQLKKHNFLYSQI